MTAAPTSRRLGGPFWRLFSSSSTSNLSDGVLQAALPLLAASLTRDPVAVATLSSLSFLPWLLFAFPAGTLVDRTNRRTAMAAANLFRGVVLAGLAGMVATGHAAMPLLYVVAFLLGIAETVYDNAARAMLPGVVSRHQLERGNSLLTTAESVGNIFLGAPVGAWLFAVAISLPLWANAGAYLIAALLVLTVAGSFRTVRHTPSSVRQDMAEGLRWLLRHRLLRSLMVVTGLGASIHSMTQGILVLFALQNLDLSTRGYGLALAAAGVGAVLGSLASPYLSRTLGRTAAMGLLQVSAALMTLLIAAWQEAVPAVIAFALSAGAISAFNVQIMSVRQALIPEALFGRVQGAYRTVIWGGIPVGTLLGGALGAWLGLTAVFVVAGAAGGVIGLATWAVLHRHRHEIDAAFADDGSTQAKAERTSDSVSP